MREEGAVLELMKKNFGFGCMRLSMKGGEVDAEEFAGLPYQPLSSWQDIFRSMNLIPCTSCRYCEAGCPKHIAIPQSIQVPEIMSELSKQNNNATGNSFCRIVMDHMVYFPGAHDHRYMIGVEDIKSLIRKKAYDIWKTY